MSFHRVLCTDCSQPYKHQFPTRIVCPKCGSVDYEEEVKTTIEDVKTINESTEPRLLLEVSV